MQYGDKNAISDLCYNKLNPCRYNI